MCGTGEDWGVVPDGIINLFHLDPGFQIINRIKIWILWNLRELSWGTP